MSKNQKIQADVDLAAAMAEAAKPAKPLFVYQQQQSVLTKQEQAEKEKQQMQQQHQL